MTAAEEAFAAFAHAVLHEELAQAERVRLQVLHEKAVNVHRQAQEYRTDAYAKLLKAIKATPGTPEPRDPEA